jgi:zinc/manganese transport system substrate-binding protein
MNPVRFSALSILVVIHLLGLKTLHAELCVASLSTITTDLAHQIGGSHVTVEGIIKPGIDPHEFEPTPGDVRKVADANLVLLTGKGMEGYLSKLEEAAGGSGKFVNVGKTIPSLTMTEDGRTVDDPHWWHSVENMKLATRIVADAFEKADPSHAASYEKNAAAYLISLDELERWIRLQIAELPHDQRKLVTSHDALQYLAHDYGFIIYPVKGVTTTEDPSSQHVKGIIKVIKEQGVKSVFFESIENPRAIQQIADETGVKPGGMLYSDGLGETEGTTYDSMMRHNVSAIVAGLK